MKNSDWKEVRLGEICLKITDGSHFSPVEQTEGYIMLSSKDMEENGFDYSDVKYISKEDYLQLVKNDCKPLVNDVLIIKDGNSYLQRIFLCKEEKEQVILSSIAIVRPNVDKVYPPFLSYKLKSPQTKAETANLVSGSAIPRIILDDFKKVKISLPPLPTQQKIADTLGAYDELIENNRRRITLLENMAAGLYKEWFVRMRPHGQILPKNLETGLPVGWEEVRFSDFIKLNRGFDLPDEKMEEGIYPVIASTGIKGFHSSFKVKGPCVTTGRSGSLGTVIYEDRDSWPLNTSLYVKDFKGNSPIFVYYTLKELNLETFNSGAGVPTLNQNHLHNLKLPLPRKELQNEFEQITVSLFNQIKTLQEQTGVLRRVRDRLLPRLMSGELGG